MFLPTSIFFWHSFTISSDSLEYPRYSHHLLISISILTNFNFLLILICQLIWLYSTHSLCPLTLCLSVCLSVRPSVCLSVRLSVRLSNLFISNLLSNSFTSSVDFCLFPIYCLILTYCLSSVCSTESKSVSARSDLILFIFTKSLF